jgi:AraC family transcriptional activator of tynA and feaB
MESMNNADLSDRESEAALEAMVCLLRPAFQQRDVIQPRKERQFQHVVALIDDHIQSESLRPEWIAAESGCPCAASTACLPRRGWWSRSTLKTVGWISVRRCCALPVMMKSWRELATAGVHRP